jgi:UDP-N-acetylglucosamine--N-acetylmuramyl-(pentapeptide) pyrophosphoryl-undecaprenol N-acetylglucosamine transferase
MFDYTIVTCGTAGHVFPALALLESLLTKHKVCLIIDTNAFKKFEEHIPINENLQIIQTIAFYPNIKGLITLFKNIKTTWFPIKNSNIIIGFLAGLQIPTLITAILLNKKFILHEQDSILNRTNSIFGFFAYKINTSFIKVKSYKFLQKKMFHSGCPVNIEDKVLLDKEDIINNKKKIITIFAGTNGSKFIDEILLHELLKINNIHEYHIYHGAKKENINKLVEFYKKNNITAYVKDYFHNFQELYKHSTLLITRGGASTISYLNFYKKKAILIPWPNSAQNHQYFNCKLIEKKAYIEVLEEHKIEEFQEKINNILNNQEENIYTQNIFKTVKGSEYII